jgi:LCP family protein required for cell wall assembly
MSADEFFRHQARDARGPESPQSPGRAPGRRRRLRRTAVAVGASAALLVGIAAGGTFFTAQHLVSSVHRLPGIVALDAARQPLMPAATRRSMTVLLTSSGPGPGPRGGSGVDGSSTAPEGASGLIALVHLNADNHHGAVVSIPANTVVKVPGHGSMKIWSALTLGGPSLLIKTVEQLTNVRIDHYSVLDFAGVAQVVGAMHGVPVTVPYTVTSLGFTFRAGRNILTASNVLAYVRQPGVSQVGRTQLQSNLIRAILTKVARQHLFSHVATDYRVLHAMAAALSVDSNFTNAQLISLALRLGGLMAGDGVFITTPTTSSPGTGSVFQRQPLDRLLWAAIRHDSVADYAQRYPFTVTPGAPG